MWGGTMGQMNWRLLAQWVVMVVLAAALGLAVLALLGMAAVIAIGLAERGRAGRAAALAAHGGCVWWAAVVADATRVGSRLVATLQRTAGLHALGLAA